jgi:hypothetical protein
MLVAPQVEVAKGLTVGAAAAVVRAKNRIVGGGQSGCPVGASGASEGDVDAVVEATTDEDGGQ